MSIDSLLERAEQCHHEVALEYYNALSGQQDRLDIAAILDKYPELYAKETLALVRETDADTGIDERARRFLKLVFTSNYFTGRLKAHTDKLANAEGDSTVELDGNEIPYRAAPVVLANETDYDKRGRLGSAFIAKLAELNPLREEAEIISRELVDELGYKNVIDMMEQLALMRIYPMRDLLAAFLDATDEIYEERLVRYAAETPGVSRETMRYADIGFLMRAGRFDHLFPPKEMVPALACNRAMGGSLAFDGVAKPEHEVLIAFYMRRDGRWKVSLYVNDGHDIDVGAIAKAHGGGGHRGAAAFLCDELPDWLQWVDVDLSDSPRRKHDFSRAGGDE